MPLAKLKKSKRALFDTELPFSFVFDGRPSSELLKEWVKRTETRELDENRTSRTLVFIDPTASLEVRCEVVEYSDYPAVEWVIHFENKSPNNIAILEQVKAMDLTWERGSRTPLATINTGTAIDLTSDRTGQGEFMVHHLSGSAPQKITDFGPIEDTLRPKETLKIGSKDGASSNETLPFFRVRTGEEGLIAAIGWSGTWEAEFVRDAERSLVIKAGMVPSEFHLRPGERIRTPRMLVLFWQGDPFRGHNLWRRLILAHYSPRPAEKSLIGPLADASMGHFTATDHIRKMDWWVENKLPLECYWIDAGWSGKTGLGWPENAASRTPNPELYPNGMREVSKAAHKRGMKFLLWMWAERVKKDVEIGAEHPEWIRARNEIDGDYGLDYGNPETLAWMKRFYSKLISEFGLDIYRQDGGRAPEESIPQVRYVEGLYDFWDHLLKEYPDLIIDNCDGGGRRIDLETCMRSIPLWRDDLQCAKNFDPVGVQGQTYGLSFYVPLSGGVSERTDPYGFRSGYSPAFAINWHVWASRIDSKNFDFDRARKLLNEYLSIRRYFYGDYYPLTEYSVQQDSWMAWQFALPETEEGMIQAFRRPKSPFESGRFKLNGLAPQSRYEVIDRDTDKPKVFTGRELMEKGLWIKIPDQPGAVVITYIKIKR